MNGIDNQFLIFFTKNSYWSVFVDIIIFWSRILLDIFCTIVALSLQEHWKYALLLLLNVLFQVNMQQSFTSRCKYSCLLYVYSLISWAFFFAIMHWLFAPCLQFRFYDQKKKHRCPKAVSFSVIKSINNSIFDICQLHHLQASPCSQQGAVQIQNWTQEESFGMMKKYMSNVDDPYTAQK